MANRTIKTSTPSVGNGENLISYNVYSDKPSAKTLLGAMTTAEAHGAGKVFPLTDGLDHNVTVYPVGETTGEYNAPSNVLNYDLAAAVNKALQFDHNNVEYLPIPVVIDNSSDWDMECTWKITEHKTATVASAMGKNGGSQIAWGRTGSSDNTGQLYVNFNGGVYSSGTPISLNTWYTTRFVWIDATNSVEIWLNGSLVTTLAGVSPPTGGTFILGKYSIAESSLEGTFEIDRFRYKTDVFELNAINGSGEVSGSDSGNIAIVTDRADVNTMLIDVA